MATTKKQKLEQFYERFSTDDHVLILIVADPDSIASAMGIRRLLWRKTASTTIAHVNVVKRSDNLTMIRLLYIKLVHISQVDTSKFSRVVLVDSQPSHNETFTDIKPHVVIDHHPRSEYECEFSDIRPEYGATASIITEYLREAKVKISERLATALFYAIKTDTSNFERDTQIDDLRAFQYLFKFANTNLVNKIEQSEIRKDFLKYFQKAIENRKTRKDWIFSNLGKVNSPDACVMAADFFLKVDEINWVVVVGVNKSKVIIIFRGHGYRRNCGKVAQQSFGQLGSAGGHKSMARAEIAITDIKKLVDVRDDKKLLNWVIKQVFTRTGT